MGTVEARDQDFFLPVERSSAVIQHGRVYAIWARRGVLPDLTPKDRLEFKFGPMAKAVYTFRHRDTPQDLKMVVIYFETCILFPDPRTCRVL